MVKPITIFGREPAAVVGFIEAALIAASVFLLGWSQDTLAAVMAVVSSGLGVYVAWVTKDTLLGVVVGFTKALIACFIVFGLDFTDSQSAAILGLVTMTVSFFQRTQTSPVAYPVDPSPTQVVPSPVDGVTPAEPSLDLVPDNQELTLDDAPEGVVEYDDVSDVDGPEHVTASFVDAHEATESRGNEGK